MQQHNPNKHITLISAITRSTPLRKPQQVAILIQEGDVWVNGTLARDCRSAVKHGDRIEIMGVGHFGVDLSHE